MKNAIFYRQIVFCFLVALALFNGFVVQAQVSFAEPQLITPLADTCIDIFV